MHINKLLQQYWGYNSFRPLQQDIIEAVLQGKDVLALLPTGGGKSICFQIPALAQDGICLVVSPLIALMKDQVATLKKKGIAALCIYSGMSFIEVKTTLQNAAYGNYKFLYVSPERLETALFLDFLPAINVNLIAVDEAHCISQWGYDFRPPYLRIAALRAHLPKIPIIALTASAVKTVQKDICDKLEFKNTHQIFQQSFERPNLSYSAFNIASKLNKLLQILQNVKGSAIVYCKSRKQTKEIADFISTNKISAHFYHAGLTNDERNKRQDAWVNNQTRVMACTNAFGMGIDKPDVRLVIHFSVPDCIENYYQEAGRAGRDGKRAYAVLLYNDNDIKDLQEQAIIRFPNEKDIKNTYTCIMNYLQIPAGNGEGNSYDFDMAVYTTTFKQHILTATYAIKTLEQENIFCFNEVFFKPSTVLFTCSKETLHEFEATNPLFELVIKGLLRSYEGIFDNVTNINEAKLASFINKPIPIIKKQLVQLHQWGIIQYMQQKEKPQITLLQNRMYADSFVLQLNDYLKRKKIFEDRIQQIIFFTKNNTDCRSKFIAKYFNDAYVKACGICDNCISLNETILTKEEFAYITKHITDLLTNKQIAIQQLIAQSATIKKEKFWKVLNFLQDEKAVLVNKHGNVQLK